MFQRKATAAVLRTRNGPFSIEEVYVSEPLENEVLIRMVAVGMCHTDLLSREMPPALTILPQVFGHEGAGVVEAVGANVSHVEEGDHVVLSFKHCGSCKSCDAGRPSYCHNIQLHNMSGGRPDGSKAFLDKEGQPIGSHFFGQSSFAGLTVAAAQSVVKADPSHDLKKLGPLDCGVQTGVGTVFNVLDVGPGSLVVAGAGTLGLTAIMAAKLRGAGSIIAIDRHESRLDLAKKYGATFVLGPDTTEMAARIQEITGGGSDYSFDTTGNAEVVRAIVNGLNHTGTCAIAGVGFGELVLDHITMISGRKIVGVMEGDATPRTFIPMMAQLNADGKLPFHELITEFPIDRINDAEAATTDGSFIKPVLIF